MKLYNSLRVTCRSAALFAVLFLLTQSVWTTPASANPWVPIANPVGPQAGNGIPTPQQVPGKDFSDIRDRDAAGVLDPEQAVAWDGSGGVRDSFDYSGSRGPLLPQDIGVDGLAAGGDALFQALRDDQSALLFSVTNDPRIHYVRPTGLPGSVAGFGVWATATDIDAMNPPIDTDAIEVWGGDNADDSDRYSLDGDPAAALPAGAQKVAIWGFNPGGPTSTPHTLTSDLAAAMDLQFTGVGVGGPMYSQLVEMMDVDAIMTFGPQVNFSIRPIPLSQFNPILPDLDGGEIFLYSGPNAPTQFLVQGGHTWNTALDIMGTFNLLDENIDGLEAVSVPEPGSIVLVSLGVLSLLCAARRRRR
jgi:hypothetical protein